MSVCVVQVLDRVNGRKQLEIEGDYLCGFVSIGRMKDGFARFWYY